MKLGKRILKWILYTLLIPISYLVVSLILSSITIDRKVGSEFSEKSIYLNTNGVHLDIIIPKENIDSLLLLGLKHEQSDKYFSFGWGDENFYLNTPTWRDLTLKNAFSAMFLKSSSLMHVTRYKYKGLNWVDIKITEPELRKLSVYLQNTFKKSDKEDKVILKNKGYSSIDDFYKANGSYSCFKTCNSWVNSGFKESGLKSCLWTPFDFGLINKYQ